MNILEKIFAGQEETKPDDGLTQAEREAILDLLVYCKFADNHLSLAEEEVLQQEKASLKWESGMDVDAYIASKATARAREAKTADWAEKALLEYVGKRLESAQAKEMANDLMLRLFQSDGETDAERAFIDKVGPYLQ